MNKMNLPPPFRLALPTPPLPKAAQQPTEVDHQSSSESEMESDEVWLFMSCLYSTNLVKWLHAKLILVASFSLFVSEPV